jgi:hypothetical protein
MDYGELLDDYVPERDNIYSYFVKYFNNPTMTKVKDINQSNGKKFSMYVCKIYGLLSNENKYIICITHGNNSSIGSVEELRTIHWISLQTRRLLEKYKCLTHSYIAKIEGPLDEVIERFETGDKASSYHCENIPEIVITLLHTEKKGPHVYQNKGKIINALETFETIVTFKEENFF